MSKHSESQLLPVGSWCLLTAFCTLVPTVQPAEVEAAVCSLSPMQVLLGEGTTLLVWMHTPAPVGQLIS